MEKNMIKKRIALLVAMLLLIVSVHSVTVFAETLSSKENNTVESTKPTESASQKETVKPTQKPTQTEKETSSKTQKPTQNQSQSDKETQSSSEKETESKSESGVATGVVSVDAEYGYIGKNVNVTISVNGTNLHGYKAKLVYDSEKLKYVSCSGATSKDGITFEVAKSSNTKLQEFTVTFEVSKDAKINDTYAVKANVELVDGKIVISNMDSVVIKEYTEKESESESESNTYVYISDDDTKLASLSIAGYSLSPKFDSDVFNYTIYVSEKVTNISVNAKTISKKSTYKVVGGKNLVPGKNTVKIICSAQDGSSKTYTVTVNKAGEVETESEEEVETQKQTQATEKETQVVTKTKKVGVPLWVTFLLCVLFMGIGFGICYWMFVGFSDNTNKPTGPKRPTKSQGSSRRQMFDIDDDDEEDDDEIEII